MEVNSVVCSKLALTRCKTYAKDINTVIFLCRDENNALNEAGIMQISHLVSAMDQELRNTYDLLAIPDDQ